MAVHIFDDSHIAWRKLGDIEHLLYSILNVDEEHFIVDVLFKFLANEKIVPHRHMIHNNTFVVQGEHRIYEPDGTLKEMRPVGSYKSSPAGDVHREGGGPTQDVIVLFNMRGTNGPFYEVLDDDQNVIATLTYADFRDLYASQLNNASD